jgi:hypothetical protein
VACVFSFFSMKSFPKKATKIFLCIYS